MSTLKDIVLDTCEEVVRSIESRTCVACDKVHASLDRVVPYPCNLRVWNTADHHQNYYKQFSICPDCSAEHVWNSPTESRIFAWMDKVVDSPKHYTLHISFLRDRPGVTVNLNRKPEYQEFKPANLSWEVT